MFYTILPRIMKLVQAKWWIITIGKKIVYHPLPSHIVYQDLANVLKHHNYIKEARWPGSYERSNIQYWVENIAKVLSGNYQKSWYSKTSANTSWAHAHYWKDPDSIQKDGVQTNIPSVWLLSLWSSRYIKKEYNIESLVVAKNELAKILQEWGIM